MLVVGGRLSLLRNDSSRDPATGLPSGRAAMTFVGGWRTGRASMRRMTARPLGQTSYMRIIARAGPHDALQVRALIAGYVG